MIDIIYVLIEKTSSNNKEIILGFILGLISSMFVFVIQNHSKNRNELLNEINALEIKLLNIRRMVEELHSSSRQFLAVYELFKKNKINSIGFPNVKDFRLNIDFSLAFQSKFSFIAKDLGEIKLVLDSLYDGFLDITIQQTQNRLINKTIDKQSALDFYTQELKFINIAYNQLSLISKNIDELLPKVSLLKSKNNNIFSYVFWKTNFSEKEIKEQIQMYMKYKKIEDYSI